MTTKYDAAFYDDVRAGSLRSARVVIPTLLNLVPVASAVDFGCGEGTWLKALQENGVSTLRGFDGNYVDRSLFQIDPTAFSPADLSQVVDAGGKFDLALSLEVGEHLPTATSKNLVESLTAAAPLIMFSAAIPGQGGTDHINEQWPNFWEELFLERGYQKIDSLRIRLWGRAEVEWWYRQNIVLYATAERIEESPVLKADRQATVDAKMEFIYAPMLNEPETLSSVAKKTWQMGLRAITRRINN